MTDAPATVPAPPNEAAQTDGAAPAGTVAHHEPCMRCGYDLRGRAMDGGCPECGEPVADSIRGDGWEHAPPAWVGGLRRGAGLLHWSLRLAPLLVYPSVVVSAIGVWRLTTRRPGDDERWMQWKRRSLARWVTIVGAAVTVGAVCAALVQTRGRVSARLLTSDSAALDAALIAGHSCFALGLMLLFDYVRKLGERVPDGVLIAATTRVWRRTAAALLAVAGLGLVARFGDAIDRGVLLDVQLAGSWLWGLAGGLAFLAICVAWWLGLLRWSGTLVGRLRARPAAPDR